LKIKRREKGKMGKGENRKVNKWEDGKVRNRETGKWDSHILTFSVFENK
jgi:hypothetical protein